MDRAAAQQQWYQRYYRKGGAGRNDLRGNPEVLFQVLAMEAALVRAMRLVHHQPEIAEVLDVGCGGGADIFQLLRMGYDPLKITAIDIQEDRLAAARRLYPQVHFMVADATRMDFESDRYDLVFESTMFATLPADAERVAIAGEMVRVCKPGGYLLLVDWRTPKLRDPHYKALTGKELRRLFAVGTVTSLVGVYHGALIPPVGRFLSKYLSSLYFLVGRLFPFLVGQVAYVLRKCEPRGVAKRE